MTGISQALATIRAAIENAEARFQRSPGSVSLLAVSKTRPVADICESLACGQHEFGENYLQEALDKISALGDPRLIWHFIGPVQSNKTRAIAEHFHWIHSLDRLKVARRLHDARPAHLPPLNVLIQINISGESSKSGITAGELLQFINGLKDFTRLRARGLMVLPEPKHDFEQQRLPFRETRRLFDEMNAAGAGLDTLSMGTTQDMEAAIAEGTTLVRIGTALFGPRR